MITATATPEVCAYEEEHRHNVEEAMLRAHGTDRELLDKILSKLLDCSMLQTKAGILTCMTVMLADNNAGNEIMRRCEEDIEHLDDYLADTPGADVDHDIASRWAALLAGLKHGCPDLR